MIKSPTDATATAVPVISIVIPTRNRPELLKRALLAISTQSFRAFEVIVIDDGSDADTQAAYVALWAKLDTRFVLHLAGHDSVKGLGPSITRNLGIGRARGEFIAFCDDDDFWTADDHLATVANAFVALPNVDMYIANQTGVSANGVDIADWMPQLHAAVKRRAAGDTQAAKVDVAELCSAGGFAHLNILVLRKAVIERAGGFWERVGYEEDRDFFWRTADCSSVILFNPRIIGQHNIPDPQQTINQSTQHSMVERWLLASLVCQHIATSVRNEAIASLARRYEGDLLRRLSMYFTKQQESARGLDYAKRALAARFSIKWAFYLMLLMCKSLLPKKIQ